MTLKLAELEAKLKDLRPQLYDNTPIAFTGTGPCVDVRIGLTQSGRKSLEFVRAIDEDE